MNYINFSEAYCKNCYKCLRSCPVKAIKFHNDQAEIVEERCISCGHCLEICPQNAREITSNLESIKQAINSGKKVAASIAPSFAGYVNFEAEKLVSILKKLGFHSIEETAVGADVISKCYINYLEENNEENYITTSCPSVNYLIEKYYPDLIKYMIPIVSPMVAHGKIMKHTYGNDSFVVFIGPCNAKKIEANDFMSDNIIDAVLTFDELDLWIKESGMDLVNINVEPFRKSALIKGRIFPKGGGIAEGIKDNIKEKSLKVISVSGTEKCIEILNSIRDGSIKNVFLEVSACEGSCIGGPSRIKNESGYYNRQQKVEEYINGSKLDIEAANDFSPKEIDFSRNFKDKSINKAVHSEEEIMKIMNKMGKNKPQDELNCGVCGYNTCREKAEAILDGMAVTDMCLHFMRSKAESLANVIIENTANSVIVLDGDMKVKEINPAAEDVFMIKHENIIGKPISMLINDEDFRKVRETGDRIIGKKVSYSQYNVVFIENIVYLPKQDLVLATLMNITDAEKNKKELVKVKENTLNAAEEVIQKQMRVAQEIASLLGETTAETKVILTQLKKVVSGESGDIQ